MKKILKGPVVLMLALIFSCFGCTKKESGSTPTPAPQPNPGPITPVSSDAAFWMTKGDKTALLAKQNVALNFGTTANAYPNITVDGDQKFQTMDGFGYTLTGGSAQLLNSLAAANRDALLRELFSADSNAIGVSYLRISIGASDLDASVFSYDDVPSGQTDLSLEHFSLEKDKAALIPILKQIIAINPAIKIVGSPWSAPAWMKTNNNAAGGKLKPEYYSVYAAYLVRYIQEMKAEGITLDAVTPQNEPLNPANNPSMEMQAAEQADFIKNHLGPAVAAAGLNTKLIIYDHNADRPDYPIAVLSDAAARAYVDGSAFHLYGGDISALTQVHNAYPDKNVYFTEQYTAATGNFGGDLAWHLRNLIIGAPRNWSKNVLEWNLANDPAYGPHTPGGCTSCLGAVTIGSGITRNVSYYIIAHAAKFVPAGSVRVGSNLTNNLQNVAFTTPGGKNVLIVLNDNGNRQDFNIKYNNKWITTALDAGAVGTYVW